LSLVGVEETDLLGFEVEVLLILNDHVHGVCVQLDVVVDLLVLLHNLGVQELSFTEVEEGGPEQSVHFNVEDLVLVTFESLLLHTQQELNETLVEFAFIVVHTAAGETILCVRWEILLLGKEISLHFGVGHSTLSD